LSIDPSYFISGEKRDVNGRQEIGTIRAQLEATKFQIIQWLLGVLTGAGALGLGISFEEVRKLTCSLYSIAYLNYMYTWNRIVFSYSISTSLLLCYPGYLMQ